MLMTELIIRLIAKNAVKLCHSYPRDHTFMISSRYTLSISQMRKWGTRRVSLPKSHGMW